LYGNWRQCWNWYAIYKASSFHTLPFAGALSDQPHWVVHNFSMFGLIEVWLEAYSDQPSAENAQNWLDADI
jgi:hypothetical protein